MPAEWETHKRCWMAWPARAGFWGAKLDGVRKDIASIARTIAEFEPVVIVVRPDQKAEATKLCGCTVGFLEAVNDDLWVRDTGPSFLVNRNGGLAGSKWNFNGWGNKQPHPNDAKVADKILAHLGVQMFDAPIITEGGALEIDGDGTLLCTESSILAANRNPGMSRERATEILKGWLGVQKVIWLPEGLPDFGGEGHIDGILKFVRPGVVLFELSRNSREEDYLNLPKMLEFLEQQTDARGRKFEVIKLYRPLKHAMMKNPVFCDCYVNCYLANGAVVSVQFGDKKSDEAAYRTLSEAYPDRKVIQLRVDWLVRGGGSIHCATQQQPLAT